MKHGKYSISNVVTRVKHFTLAHVFIKEQI